MSETNPYLVRAKDLANSPEFGFGHPLNPNSEVYLRNISDLVGLQRLVLRWGRIPPGKESFIYHAHHHEEEFLYILSGRGIAEIADQEFEVGAGDFMGFPTPSVAHHLRNPFDTDLVYLMGGERKSIEIGDYPRHQKRVIRDGNEAYIIDLNEIQFFTPRPIEEEEKSY
ncbi:cupin domain-containing protein [Oscillatoria salina]|uniref:cupin domain-containing protein n=1 Tax=Oscillatoria salina TaxID=331517 RepID=UPI001CCA4851|nr:cupin domain-containing protein [Oscillatoria salina]MBZ8180750.1 cupin domain-containing protein [Oscillatoria salina IIICB1]